MLDSTKTPWWWVLAGRLWNNGYSLDMIHTVDMMGPVPGLSFFSPKFFAKKIGEKVEKIRNSNFGDKVDIVAHSLGGIASRWYVEKLEGEEYVDKLVTIATPHQGTYFCLIPPLNLTPGGKEILPGSDLIEELNEGSLAESVDYIAVWSLGDWAIIPKKNAKLQGVDNINPGFLPHIGLVQSERSFKKAILPALQEE